MKLRPAERIQGVNNALKGLKNPLPMVSWEARLTPWRTEVLEQMGVSRVRIQCWVSAPILLPILASLFLGPAMCVWASTGGISPEPVRSKVSSYGRFRNVLLG